MLCKSPYVIDGMACRCEKCMPCRIYKKRLWTFRLSLEAAKFPVSCVATLTYSDPYVPKGERNGIVCRGTWKGDTVYGTHVKQDVRNWLKRLRKVVAPQKIRYFLVAEYGTKKTHRPHIHVILFNLSADLAGGPPGLHGRIGGVVKQTWPYGNTLVDDCSEGAISYVAGYVTKKLTSQQHETTGSIPEFTRMSLRPHGIGAGTVEDIARVMASKFGLRSIAESGDVPYALRRAGKTLPLGRYLRGLLRERLKVGRLDAAGRLRNAPPAKVQAFRQEMLELLKKNVSFTPHEARAIRREKIKQFYVDMCAQECLNLEARAGIFASKHTL